MYVDDCVDDDWLGHDLVDVRALARVKVKHGKDQGPQLVAVMLRYRGERAAHDLQD